MSEFNEKIHCSELLEIAKSIHRKNEDFQSGDLEERIMKVEWYYLTTVNPIMIDQEWKVDEEKVEEYADLDPAKAPPIILYKYGNEHYSVVDGQHRIESFKRNKVYSTLAYVGEVSDDGAVSD